MRLSRQGFAVRSSCVMALFPFHGTRFAVSDWAISSNLRMAIMAEQKVDKTRVDPLTGAEEQEPPPPLRTVPPGEKPNATNAEIPGTGRIIRGRDGKEVGREITT